MTLSHETERFEFRFWLHDAGVYIKALENLCAFEGVEERVDIYALSPRQTEFLPKLRGGKKFEIKRLIQTTQGGFELWSLPLETTFPFSLTERHTLHEAFPGLPADNKTLDQPEQLLTLLSTCAEIHAVRKLRRLYRLGPCAVEATRAIIDLKPHETVAIECSDESAAKRLLDAIGAANFENLHYGKVLHASRANAGINADMKRRRNAS